MVYKIQVYKSSSKFTKYKFAAEVLVTLTMLPQYVAGIWIMIRHTLVIDFLTYAKLQVY